MRIKVRTEVLLSAFDAAASLKIFLNGAVRSAQRLLELSAGRRITRARYFEF